MDHFQLGRVAYEARHFVEADTHLKRVDHTLNPTHLLELRTMQLACAKILRPQSCWQELFQLARLHIEHKKTDALLELLEREEKIIPDNQKSQLYSARAEGFYRKGWLAEARRSAVEHVDYLLRKKLSTHLLEASKKYEIWFPQTLYFSLIQFQALILLEDSFSARKLFIAINESIQRKWSRIEDKKENSKSSLLKVLAESAARLEVTNGESVLLGHRTHLSSLLESRSVLLKEDWKKMLELIVREDSWDHLKLALEIAIQNNENEIALETYAQLKKKRGFSFVKLTKHDSHLRDWLLQNAGARPARPEKLEQVEALRPEDLRLSGKESIVEMVSDFSDFIRDDEELKAVELNAVKQLELHEVGVEALPDLLVAYKMLGFHRVVSWLLNKFPLVEGNPDFKKKIQYFRVIHAIDLKDNFLALAYLEEMLGDSSLNLDEFKELKYAQGSLLMGMGRKEEAQQSFKEVGKVDPTYRQTRERMNKIAQD